MSTDGADGFVKRDDQKEEPPDITTVLGSKTVLYLEYWLNVLGYWKCAAEIEALRKVVTRAGSVAVVWMEDENGGN